MALQYSPKIVQDSLVMCLDASNNKSYPTDLPLKDQLNLWLDAADDTTFSYSSGTTVSQWRDKSGQNNHAIVMAGSPLRSVAINSRKAVSFTSTTAFKCVTGSFSSTATHIVVCRATTSSATYQRVYHGGANSDFYVFIGAFQNSIATFWGSGPNTWFDTNPNSPSTTILNTLRIISAVNNGSTATPYYDGIAMSTKATTNSAAYTGYELNTYSGGAAFQPLIGEVCEIIVFNKQLSLTELKQVHTYLGQKWGISNTDRSIIDLAGNDDNGLFGNGTVANMPDYDFYNKGALTFNGTSDYVNLGNASSIRMGTSNFTISTWVKILTQTGTPTFKLIITSKNAAAAAAGYGFAWNNSVNKFLWSTANGSSSSEIFTTNTWSSLEGVWANIVMVRQNGATNNGHFYINGVYESLASAATVLNVDTTTNMTIANTADLNSSYWFKGLYGPVHIYNKALSAVEVAQNYEAQKSKFANTIVQQGLVLNLDAGNPYSYGGAGTTFYDVSPTALSWTINNATYNSSDPKYFSYNGSNSWLESSTSAAYDSQTITMECWFYPSPLSQEGFLFEKGAVNSQYSMFLSLTAFYFRTFGGTINNQDLTFASSTYLTANVWNHVICTYNGSIKIIYVNGVQVASVNASGTLNTGQTNQYIGKYGNAGNNYPFNGRIGETRVYNIALSAAQVLQNYNATKGRFGL
jgi:hypothetical protein